MTANDRKRPQKTANDRERQKIYFVLIPKTFKTNIAFPFLYFEFTICRSRFQETELYALFQNSASHQRHATDQTSF